MEPAPPLPKVSPELRAWAERIQLLTEEMAAGKEADDWGRVTAAQDERRPLLSQLVEGGFRQEGGEQAEQWLKWLLETEQELLQQGRVVREEMLKERRNIATSERAVDAYKKQLRE